jgi:hypothetical protein
MSLVHFVVYAYALSDKECFEYTSAINFEYGLAQNIHALPPPLVPIAYQSATGGSTQTYTPVGNPDSALVFTQTTPANQPSFQPLLPTYNLWFNKSVCYMSTSNPIDPKYLMAPFSVSLAWAPTSTCLSNNNILSLVMSNNDVLSLYGRFATSQTLTFGLALNGTSTVEFNVTSANDNECMLFMSISDTGVVSATCARIDGTAPLQTCSLDYSASTSVVQLILGRTSASTDTYIYHCGDIQFYSRALSLSDMTYELAALIAAYGLPTHISTI